MDEKSIGELFKLNGSSLGLMFGIVDPGKAAVFSSHQIARHFLSSPDFEIEDGYEGLDIPREALPSPKIEAVPATYTEEEQAKRDAFRGVISSRDGTQVSYRPERIPFRVKFADD